MSFSNEIWLPTKVAAEATAEALGPGPGGQRPLQGGGPSKSRAV